MNISIIRKHSVLRLKSEFNSSSKDVFKVPKGVRAIALTGGDYPKLLLMKTDGTRQPIKVKKSQNYFKEIFELDERVIDKQLEEFYVHSKFERANKNNRDFKVQVYFNDELGLNAENNGRKLNHQFELHGKGGKTLEALHLSLLTKHQSLNLSDEKLWDLIIEYFVDGANEGLCTLEDYILMRIKS